jgi:hypothetical protein
MRCFLIRLLLCVGILMPWCSALRAQDSGRDAAILLEVRDQAGGFIPDAKVQIRPSSSNLGSDLKTDSSGNLLLALPAGAYDLSVTSPGFVPGMERVQVKPGAGGAHETISVVLQVGGCPPGCGVVVESDGSPASSPAQSQVAKQDLRPPDCSAGDLDVNLVPQVRQPAESDAHWLALEIRNREQVTCTLPDLAISFPDAGNEFNGYNRDSSKSALAFKKKSPLLEAGEVVHLLLAWSSATLPVDGLVMDDCAVHDLMTLSFWSPQHKTLLLEVRHVPMKICNRPWQSSLRLGPYIPGETIEKEWLDRFHLKQSDFAPGVTARSAEVSAAGEGVATLRALSGVEYLKGPFESGQSGYFELFLKLPSPAFANCPFDSLRKREADGQTVIYMNYCDDRHVKESHGTRTTRVLVREMGLLPERTGHVEYDSVSEVSHRGRPLLAQSRLELSIRDPNKPALPAIEISTPGCMGSQLRLTVPPMELGNHWSQPRTYPPVGEEWFDGKVFEVTNISDQNCMLGGTPDLKFLDLLPPVCRNCETPLFKRRESRWIELKPNDAAHFIVVRHLLDHNYWSQCAATGGINMLLMSGPPAIRLPFEAGICAQVRVSAWRAGPYDRDPMNVQYEREENQREQQRIAAAEPLPKEFLEEVSADTGEPVIFGRGSITWGLSTKAVSYGEPIPVLLWLYNSTDEPQPVMRCQDIDCFWFSDINLFDSAGHRVLSIAEQKEPKLRDSGRVRISSYHLPIYIPPHTLMHGRFSKQDPNFARDLQSYYSLPPGQYLIVPSQSDQDGNMKTPSDRQNGLRLVVQEP